MSGVSFIWPVHYPPEFPWGRYPSGGYHPAYDLACPTGTTVVAPASGIAYEVGWDTSGYGWHVRIEHSNGWISILAHNESFLIKQGDFVQQGQGVSISDSSGNVTGPHCHWETRTSRYGLQRYTAFDPGPYIGAAIVDPPAGPVGPTPPPASAAPNYVGGVRGTVLLAPAPSIDGTPDGSLAAFTRPVIVPGW